MLMNKEAYRTHLHSLDILYTFYIIYIERDLSAFYNFSFLVLLGKFG